jgi:ABC-type cobalamin/Fe3+-siderophores transport system ATPase subunit
MITKLEMRNFTVFNNLSINFSPKINVIIGENGTGKTHLLKAAYYLCGDSNLFKSETPGDQYQERRIARSESIVRLFKPLEDRLGKLRSLGTPSVENAKLAALFDGMQKVKVEFHSNSKWLTIPVVLPDHVIHAKPVFIPTKEVLSFMTGFTSLYDRYELSYDKTYYDICLLLDLPKIRQEALHEKSKWAMEEIENTCSGRFIFQGGGNVTFKPKTSNKTDTAEYSANTMAEGFRKIGMLSRLLETEAIRPGVSGPLFWDEPEGNLNPKLLKLLVEILLELSRNGQQVILATHDYVLLKWFDLLMDKGKADHVVFHTLYRDDEKGEVKVASTDSYQSIQRNAIADTYSEIYDETINYLFGDKTK